LKEYPNKIIFLILDNATYHTSHMVQDWSKNHTMIKFLWLPKNNPQLNPVEKIWWCMKDIVAANNSYKGLKHMKQKCIEFLTNLTPEAAIRLTSIAV
jgi:transposase